MTRIAIERAIRSPFSGQPERYNRRPSISCEFYVSTWARWVVAAGIAIYMLSLDVCLLLGAPVSPSRSHGELALGLIIQSACLVAISRLIVATTSYFKFVHDYLKAITINGKIGVLYSNKDYGCEWDYDFRNKRFYKIDNTKFSVNVVMYALTS